MAVANKIEGLVVGVYGTGLKITLTMVEPNTTTAVDISSYTDIQAFLRSPDGRKTEEQACSFLTDGTDGKITFSLDDGDLDRDGEWTATVEFVKTGNRAVSYPIKIPVLKRAGANT